MSSFKGLVLPLLILLQLPAQLAFTQSMKITREQSFQKHKSEKFSTRQIDILNFPDLEKNSYFFSEGKLERIKKNLNQGTSLKAYEHLREYFHQFSISNFRSDGFVLFQLAQLAGRFGSPGEKLSILKLILKHRPVGIDSTFINESLDSLRSNELKIYLSAELYAERINQQQNQHDSIASPSLIENLGNYLNSKYADYAPVIGNRDEILLFTSKRNLHSSLPDAPPDEDLFVSSRDGDIWNRPVELRAINTSLNEGSACLSRDGKLLIFSRCAAPGSIGNCDLYEARLNEDSVWSEIKNMGGKINSTGWDSHPALSLSGDTLYFASSRLGGFGMSDIYFSVRRPDDSWGVAKNMGPVINTRLSEVSPFLHHKYNVLYYSSDGLPLSFGSFDIYLSRFNGKRWGEPVNAGPLINGSGSDYYFTVDAGSSEIFFSRPPSEGSFDMDIYSVSLPMEAHPLAQIIISGTVLREDGQPAEGIVYIFDLENRIEIAPKFLTANGTFNFSLIKNRKYLLVVEGDGFQKLERRLFVDDPLQVDLTVADEFPRITFSSIQFEPAKADILPPMIPDLQRLGQLLNEHPEWKLKIAGHADAAGEVSIHEELSQLRADAIKNFLIAEYHISPDRLHAIGYGSRQPLVHISDQSADRSINRRVEFEIYR